MPQSVSIIGKWFANKWGVIEEFLLNETLLDKFFMELERGYLDNPYHNACHAADVSHTLIYFFTMS